MSDKREAPDRERLILIYIGRNMLDHVQDLNLGSQKTERQLWFSPARRLGEVGAWRGFPAMMLLVLAFTTFYVFLPRLHTQELTLR